MSVTENFSAQEQDGVMAGPVRRPVNISRDAKGSIHDDATAKKLGFRGGTVAANIHFEQFPPLMLARFGPGWSRTGGLSLHFLNPTTDGEPVQAFVGPVEQGAAPRAKAFIAKNAPLAFYQDPAFTFPSALKPPVMGFPTTLIYDKRGRARAVVASDVDWAGDQVRRVVGKLAAEPA